MVNRCLSYLPTRLHTWFHRLSGGWLLVEYYDDARPERNRVVWERRRHG